MSEFEPSPYARFIRLERAVLDLLRSSGKSLTLKQILQQLLLREEWAGTTLEAVRDVAESLVLAEDGPAPVEAMANGRYRAVVVTEETMGPALLGDFSWEVRHEAKSCARAMRPTEMYLDYAPPILSHKFDVVLSSDELPWPLSERHPEGLAIARLVVNEFPLHLMCDPCHYAEWFWKFDVFDEGPSATLGTMIDLLEQTGHIDFGEGDEGAVLHLQNLEVHPNFRRHGLGSRLIKFALCLLSRSDYDLVVAEMQDVAASWPVLFPGTLESGESTRGVAWEDPTVIMRFMRSLGFWRWVNGTPEKETTRMLNAQMGLGDVDAPVFYRSVDGMDRITWRDELSGREAALLGSEDEEGFEPWEDEEDE